MPSLWDRLRSINHKCAATDIDELKELTEQAQTRIDYVLKGGKILQEESEVLAKLQRANDHLEDVSKSLEKASTLCKDIGAISDIHDAMETLNTELIVNDPTAAAKAFEKLFRGFGVVCKHLPFPGNQWATFFGSVGTFFEDIQKMGDPMTRQSGSESRQFLLRDDPS